MSEGSERRLAAIVAIDVAGYSRLMGADEQGTLTALKAHREAMRPMVQSHSGRLVGTAGDGLLLEFPSVVAAVECAIEMQRSMVERNVGIPEGRKMLFRAGINLGDVLVDGDDIYGDGVNVAARLESLAAPGGIALSDDVYRQVRDRLDVPWSDGGEHEVKNIARPVHAWRWAPEGIEPAPVDLTPRGRTPQSDRSSIAVLPFANLSADAEQEYFVDGMTDDLITHLSKVDGLFVIARNSVFTYKGVNEKVQQVAEDLGVRFVLEGSVRRGGNVVRINAQLIDAETGGHLWADIFDRDMSDIFALQDEVIGEIVAALKANLGNDVEAEPTATRTDPKAYDIFLRAREAYRTLTHQGLTDALQLFQEAITLDPTFADAYAGDATTAAQIWAAGFGHILPTVEARNRAEQSLSRALRLEPAHANARLQRAHLVSMEGNHEEAIAIGRDVVAAEPNNAFAHFRMASLLQRSGLPEDAEQEIEIALRLDPKPDIPSLDAAGHVYFELRNYEKALSVFREIQSRTPNAHNGNNGVLVSAAKLGLMDEARAALEANYKIFPGYSMQLWYIFYRDRAISVREHLIAAMREGGVPEWPFGFQGEDAERLEGREIEALFFGRTIKGDCVAGEHFTMEVAKDGAFRTQIHAYKRGGKKTAVNRYGTIRISDGAMCETDPTIMLGREACYPIFRDRENMTADRNAYAWASSLNVFRFSEPA